MSVRTAEGRRLLKIGFKDGAKGNGVVIDAVAPRYCEDDLMAGSDEVERDQSMGWAFDRSKMGWNGVGSIGVLSSEVSREDGLPTEKRVDGDVSVDDSFDNKSHF